RSLKEELKRVNDELARKENVRLGYFIVFKKDISEMLDWYAFTRHDYENRMKELDVQIKDSLAQKAAKEATIIQLHKELTAHRNHVEALAKRLDHVHSDVDMRYQTEIQDLKDCLMMEQEEKNELNGKLQNLEKELLISKTKLAAENKQDLSSNRNVENLKQKVMKLRKENESLILIIQPLVLKSEPLLHRPYTPSTVTIPAVLATDDSPEVSKRTAVETILNMSSENKAHYESEKEPIHLLLTSIGDEIYSTVDACKTAHEKWIPIERLQHAHEKWIAIERLQHGESLNIQDVKTNLFWEFEKLTSHDGESKESYYSRFYKMMNEMIRNNLTVATMQVNYQKEVNEIRAERIAKNANPLAFVAAVQPYPNPYYQASKSHKSYATPSKQSSSIRSNASTIYKGKEIAKPITPSSESAFKEDSDPEQAQRDKDMPKNLALIAKYFKKIYKPTNNNLRTSSNSRNKNVDTSLNSGNVGSYRKVTTRYKGKEIAKPITPPSETAAEEDNDPEQAQKDKDI
nr:hypothetical protein [Tanacetum cinerariifolium]